MKHIVRIASVGLGISLAQLAVAQTDEERAGARAAAEQGVKAFQEGRYADAAALMAGAERIVHAPTHLLYQAQAEEKLGHLVIAHELYLRIAREPLRRDAPQAFVLAQAEAKQRADAVRPRFSQVAIVVEGARAGASVKVTADGAAIPSALLGVPYPIDPGEHQFEATVDGLSSGPIRANLREGATEKVVLKLKTTEALATPAVGAPSIAPQPATNATPAVEQSGQAPATTPTQSTGTHPLKLGGYIGLGVGVVGLGVGTLFAVRSAGSRSDANALCNGPGGKCPTTSQSQIDDLDAKANSSGTLAVVGFVAGGVAAAAGVTMLLLAPKQERPRSAFVIPYVAPNGAGVWGRF